MSKHKFTFKTISENINNLTNQQLSREELVEKCNMLSDLYNEVSKEESRKKVLCMMRDVSLELQRRNAAEKLSA